jgi:hypothetical protein
MSDREIKKAALTAMHDMGKAHGLAASAEMVRALMQRGKRLCVGDLAAVAVTLDDHSNRLHLKASTAMDAVTGQEAGHG